MKSPGVTFQGQLRNMDGGDELHQVWHKGDTEMIRLTFSVGWIDGISVGWIDGNGGFAMGVKSLLKRIWI